MIIVDTNVISEAMHMQASERVLTWFNSLQQDTVFLTSITYGEILVGIALLPAGKRRQRLEILFSTIIDARFGAKILPYDRDAASLFPGVMLTRRQLGRPTSLQDGQIAAIALVHEATLATRNVKDFEGIGIDLINPWEAHPGS